MSLLSSPLGLDSYPREGFNTRLAWAEMQRPQALATFEAVENAQIAQLVEQRIENPRVGGSIPPLGTITYR